MAAATDNWGSTPRFNDNWGAGSADANWNAGGAPDVDATYGQTDYNAGSAFHDGGNGGDAGAADDKCFGCREIGHRRAECPNPEEMTCRYCKQPGHMVKECPDKPPMVCDNCGEDGHMRNNCENPRKVNRDHIDDVEFGVAWERIKIAVAERDADDAKKAVQEYVKAVNCDVTLRELQQTLIMEDIGLWLIATERQLLKVFTNMDFQGNMGKKYSISYRFSENPDRPREIEGWPKSRDEILARLDDAGEVVDVGRPLCSNCNELGHISKHCTQEKAERTDAPRISCYNCGNDGHRVRDCPEPRVDKFACKNCGKSGHKVAECEEPPNPANVECRKCNEIGHFAKDCPQGGGHACRNCGQEGHIARECDQPRNMENVTCRNCEKNGHFSRDCPEPKDWSKVQCSNCQEFGHTKVRCKQPPANNQDMDNGSYNQSGTEAVQADGGDTGGGDWGAGTDASQHDTGGW